MFRKLSAWFHVKDHRSRIYGYAGTLGGIAVAVGWIGQTQESGLLVSVGAILGLGGTGLAKLHTPTRRTVARRSRKAAR